VSQATGMLIAPLGVSATQALARLRAHAYATDRSATDVARDILDRRLRLQPDWWGVMHTDPGAVLIARSERQNGANSESIAARNSRAGRRCLPGG
jgi:ANTAR domain